MVEFSYLLFFLNFFFIFLLFFLFHQRPFLARTQQWWSCRLLIIVLKSTYSHLCFSLDTITCREWNIFIFHQIFTYIIMYLLEFLMIFSECKLLIILDINYIMNYSDILYFIKLLYTIMVILERTINIFSWNLVFSSM